MTAKKKSPKIYSLTMEHKDEFDRLKQLVQLFSYHWHIQGRASSVLRNKLIILLTLYLMYGFSKKTKEKASEVLSVHMASINSMNLELRTGGYLKKDPMNTRINHLHSDLLLLKGYVEDLEETKGHPLILFQLKRKNV